MLNAQNNTTCQTAAILQIDTICNPSNFSFGNGQSDVWLSFITSNNAMQFHSIFSIPNFYLNNNSEKPINLYKGGCNNLQLMKLDTMHITDSLFYMVYENLDTNSTYYIEIKRQNISYTEIFNYCLQKVENIPFQVEVNGLNGSAICQCLAEGCNNVLPKVCSSFFTTCLEEELIFQPTPNSGDQNGAGDIVEWRIADNNYNVIFGPYVTTYNGLTLDPFYLTPSSIPLSVGNSYWVVASYYNYLPGYGYTCFWAEAQMEIFITDKPFPAFTINPPPPYCINQQIQLIDNTINHPSGIDSWDMGDGGNAYGYGSAFYDYITPGIYTITYTKSNVCGENTITQEIEIGPYPKFEVPEPLCAGQEFTFNNTTNCLQYVQSWFWDFGDGFSSTQPNPSHTYTNPGIYTVTLCLTDANGQQHCITQSVEVHPSPAPPVILGNLFVCDPQAMYCVQSPQPGHTYQWVITNGTPVTATGPCVNVQWNQNNSGFITLTVTNEYGCIALTEKEVAECCYKEDINNPGTEINLYNTSASFIINNILGGSTTWTTNTYINLNGVMEIDQDFTFSNCPNIYLGQNARINIPAGKKLRIENASKLEAACPDKMWDGIYLQTYTSQLETDFSTFMHAQNAIVSQNGAKYTITSSTFNQNWIGIKVEPFSFNHLGTITASGMGPTSFLCTAPLMYPHLDKRSHAGIYIQQVGNQNGSITVGHSVLFDNQNTGVLAEASNVLVKGCVFQNMGIVQGQGGGIGVHTKGGDLGAIKTTVGGLPSNTNNFNNCFTGVLIEGWQDAEISYNNFTGTNTTAVTGIRVQHITKYGQPIPYKNITIKNNTITNYQTGINLYSNMNAIVLVQKNTINQQGVPFGSGIIAQEMPISITFNLTTIKQNTITATATGIHASGLTNALIEDNTVSKLKQFPLFNTYGVLLRACNSARVRDNSVSSQQPSTNTHQHGYAFEMSEATFATCNEANKTGTGMRCAGAMPSTNLWGNTFMQNHTGFRLAGNGLIGPQFRNTPGNEWASDNRWIGNHTDRSNASGSTPSASPFYVRNTSGNNPYNPNSINSSNPLIPILSTGNIFKCAIINNPEINANPAKKKLLQEIAQAQLNLPQPDTALWLSQLAAYLTIRENQQLLADTVLSNFYDSMLISNPRAIQVIDSLMFDSASCNNTLLAACNSINPANIQEQWLKEIAFIYISSKLSGDTFTTQQIQQLQYIASLCPYTDGMAVYQARFLLTAFDTTIYENNCELDINGNGQRLAPEEERESTVSENTSIKVYPNPAAETVVVELPEDTLLYISVYNPIGQLVLEKVTKNKVTNIDITNLPNGTYNVKARGDNIIFNTKLIIIK